MTVQTSYTSARDSKAPIQWFPFKTRFFLKVLTSLEWPTNCKFILDTYSHVITASNLFLVELQIQ